MLCKYKYTTSWHDIVSLIICPFILLYILQRFSCHFRIQVDFFLLRTLSSSYNLSVIFLLFTAAALCNILYI